MYSQNVYNVYNVYKKNSVNYASKDQLLLVLVEGAVKFAQRGKQAILNRDIKRAHENIIKTQSIFYELMITLDVSKGGNWARPMMNIYDFIVRRLIDANMKKDAKIMDQVIPLIENVRDTWEQAYKIANRAK